MAIDRLLESDKLYLSRLAGYAAVELDLHSNGEYTSFEHLSDLTTIVEKYQLEKGDTNLSGFPYLSVWEVSKKYSDSEVRTNDQLADYMGGLTSLLKDSTSSREKANAAKNVVLDLSKQFSRTFCAFDRVGLAA